MREKPQAQTVPDRINQCWSMDFMHDQFSDWRSCRLLNVIEVDLSQPSVRVTQVLDNIIEWRGKPEAIRCVNAPEYIKCDWLNSPW